MFKAVNIHTDSKSGIITISSKPEAFAIVLLIACLLGVCSLPFTEYRTDYFAYVGLFFVVGLTAYYAVSSLQSTIFDKERISVRKGLKSWEIPLESVSGGTIIYRKKTSRQSLASTHFLNLELQVNLPDDPSRWIRNGKANIFHYGFNRWGRKQKKIKEQLKDILKEKGIPNLMP